MKPPGAAVVQDAPSSSGREAQDPEFHVPDHVRQRNAAFVDRLRGKLILAPLTKGGNLPFRRLCADFGAEVTMSEMAFARALIRGDTKERAMLRKAANEVCFGVQIATKQIAEGVRAAELAREAGAAWIDINCGCPIYEATRRGMGSALLRKPTALAKMVNGIVKEVELPVTVKIRSGVSEKSINAERVARLLGAAGVAAVTIHGRSAEQRYKRAADWALIGSAAATSGVPIIGNGDILTHYEAADRFAAAAAAADAALAAAGGSSGASTGAAPARGGDGAAAPPGSSSQLPGAVAQGVSVGGEEGGGSSGAAALMVGRGALIKPWVFQEWREGRELCLSASDRLAVYRRLVSYMKEHFGDDAMGRRKAFYFLPWHFDFLTRYRHYPLPLYHDSSRTHPLIATRVGLSDPLLGEEDDALPPLERLLRCRSSDAHAAIAAALWDSGSDAECAADLLRLAAGGQLGEWERQAAAGDERGSGGGGADTYEG